MSVIHLSKEGFNTRVARSDSAEWKYLGDKPAVIDFFASWCGPCKALSPVYEEVANHYGDKVHFYKVDVDEEDELAQLFDVRSVPTLLFVPLTGQPSKRTGVLPKTELERLVTEMVEK